MYHEIPDLQDEQIVAALNRIVEETPGIIGTCDEDKLIHLVTHMNILDNLSDYTGALE